jgi:putative transposase
MTDVTRDTEAGKGAVSAPGAVNDGLIAELVARVQADGVNPPGN